MASSALRVQPEAARADFATIASAVAAGAEGAVGSASAATDPLTTIVITGLAADTVARAGAEAVAVAGQNSAGTTGISAVADLSATEGRNAASLSQAPTMSV